MVDREKVIKGLECCASISAGIKTCGYIPTQNDCPYAYLIEEDWNGCDSHVECTNALAADSLKLLKDQEPRVLTLDEAAAAQEVWVEAWLRGPNKYVIKVTILYLTDDCKNFELELLGTDKKAFMLAEAYGHTWRCWSAKPTDDQRKAVKWGAD